MNNGLMPYILSAMVGAISALWFRMGRMQYRLDELVRTEAVCQAKLDALQATLERKHEENKAAIASLYCMRDDK